MNDLPEVNLIKCIIEHAFIDAFLVPPKKIKYDLYLMDELNKNNIIFRNRIYLQKEEDKIGFIIMNPGNKNKIIKGSIDIKIEEKKLTNKHLKSMRNIILKKIKDSGNLPETSSQNASNRAMARDFLLDKNSSLSIYLGLIGIDKDSFNQYAVKILNMDPDNFCEGDKKEQGIKFFSKSLNSFQKLANNEKIRKVALKCMFRSYISSYVKFALTTGN